jgi:hypothetical protein
MRTRRGWAVAALAAAVVLVSAVVTVGCGGDSEEEAGAIPDGVSSAEWGTYGYSYEQPRYVPFTEIDKDNVAELGRVFTVDFQEADPEVPGGQQSQPLIVDGVLYATTSFNHVYAVDARTGKVRWHFAPSRIGAFKNFGVTTTPRRRPTTRRRTCTTSPRSSPARGSSRRGRPRRSTGTASAATSTPARSTASASQSRATRTTAS